MTPTEVSTTGFDFEYRGLMAQTWDLFRGDTSVWEDRFFFLDMLRKHGTPALDVGCGTGRLLLDFMAQGFDVDGVDNSPEMLALCREKAAKLNLRPRLYQQAMAGLDLPRQYQLIMVPSSSFQLLTDLDQARRAMSRFYAQLQSGGMLVMPFMLCWIEGETHSEWRSTGEKTRPNDGAVARRWSRAEYDLVNQLEHTEDKYELTLNGTVIAFEYHRRSPATRWYSQAQAVNLYREAGFVDIAVSSGFSLNQAIATDTLFAVQGRKP